MNGPLVTVGVPVYQGQDTLTVLLETLRTQSYENVDVLISVDNSDLASAEVCKLFLERDSRFRMHVQPSRLGWAGNTDWTMRNGNGEFYIYQQHDDLFSHTYIEDLVKASFRYQDAAICFARLQYTGLRTHELIRPSLIGDPQGRLLQFLHRLDWVPFRGLIRGSALKKTSGLLLSDFNPFDSYGTEHRLMAELAILGEFRFVEGPTYFKSWHGDNLSGKRASWSEEHRHRAIAQFAAWMIEVIVPSGNSVGERRQLFWHTLAQFITGGRSKWMRNVNAWLLRRESKALLPLHVLRNQLKRSRRLQTTIRDWGGMTRMSVESQHATLAQMFDHLRRAGRLDPVKSLDRSWNALETETLRRYSH